MHVNDQVPPLVANPEGYFRCRRFEIGFNWCIDNHDLHVVVIRSRVKLYMYMFVITLGLCIPHTDDPSPSEQVECARFAPIGRNRKKVLEGAYPERCAV